MTRLAAWSTLLLFTLGGMAAHAQSAAPPTPSIPSASAQSSVRYAKLPLSFEPNVGQTSPRVQWLARGPEYTLFLAGHDAVLEMSRTTPAVRQGSSPTLDTTTLRMNLLGGNPASSSTGEQVQSGKANYFTGNSPANWHRDVSLYGRVRLHEVYPGIDLAYYGHQGQLEYDFIVAPGADPAAIRVRFDGAMPKLAGNGDLVLPVNGTEVRFHQPVVYQMVDGKRHLVDGAFRMAKNGQVSFQLGSWDRSRELVIDPTLVFTGTFGTASENDTPSGMDVDAKGELIVTGMTNDLNFPATSGAYQTSCGPVSADDTKNGVIRCAVGNQSSLSSAYVMKLSADGTQLVYATYLHGITGWEKGSAVKADASGNAVVIGQTASSDFPLVNAPAIVQMSLCQPHIPNGGGAPVQTCNGYFNGGGTEWTIQGPSGFISKLSADGSSLLYSAFMGFSGTVYPQALALDASGNMYMLNQVNNADPSPNPNNPNEVLYPTTSSAFQTGGVGDYETALTVLSANGQTIMYSTIFGETQPVANGCGSCLSGTVPSGIAVGQNGTVFIAGETTAGTLPVTAGAVQTSCILVKPSECTDNAGYVAAFDITKSGTSSLKWATYVSGPENPNTAVSTQLNAIAVDAQNNVYLTGYTTDALFPVTTGALASTCPLDARSGANFCDNSVFISKLNSTGTAYDWSTFLAPTQGASSSANSNGIALDAKGNVYVYGDSGTLIVPAVNPLAQYPNAWYQPYPFLAVLNPTGSSLVFSSQIAPNNYVSSMHNGLALDPAGNIYMIGNTQGGQTYYVGSSTLTAWPTTKGTYSTAISGTGPIPFFVKIAALLQPSTTTLKASPTTSTTGQNVTFTATVAGTSQTTPAPTGTVTLTNTAASPAATLGTIDLSGGTGTYSTTSLTAGTYTIVGTYSSDSVYDVSTSSPVTVTVNTPAKATVSLSGPASAIFGSSVTFTATVSGSGGTPTGTVTFFDGTTQLGTGTLSSGTATFKTSSLAAGSHSITAGYGGDSTFGTATSAASTIVITALAAPAVALTVPATAVAGSSVTLSVKVSGSGATPTGSVTFLDGTTTLNTATLTGGAASYSTSSLAVGEHSITADYTGDTNYSAGVSAAQTLTITAPAADFAITANPTSATIAAGATTTSTISITPSNGFNSATALSCSGLPANATCSFSPASLTPGGSSAATSTLTIATNVSASSSAALRTGSNGQVSARLTLAGSGGALLALLCWPASWSRSWRRNKRQAWVRMLAILAFSVIGVQALAGCGGSSKAKSGSVTPAGTSTVTITGTAGSVTHSTTLTLTVQ
jgi:hypothetical protein